MILLKNSVWLKRIAFFCSFAIVLSILWNTFVFFQKFKHEERLKMQILATALKELVINTNPNTNFSLNNLIISTNISIPTILTDEKGVILSWRNLDTVKAKDPSYLALELKRMKIENKRIEINFKDKKQFIYYENSNLLSKLTYYPLALVLILALLLTTTYMFFSSNKIAEQNKLWTAMARETAHQIGTPLSSLLGWIEILKSEGKHSTSLLEMEKDIARLHIIANRFSKIGSLPKLELRDIVRTTKTTFDYLKWRSSKQVNFIFKTSKAVIIAQINVELFNWVIENLIKNAIDAMRGKGTLNLTITETQKNIKIIVADTGKGVQKAQFRRIFKPGFTTKKRGWGLGLSLSRRIVEDYHGGKIAVLKSSVNKGTHFQILLVKPSSTPVA